MKSSLHNRLVATVLLTEGLIFGGAGISIGHADDAPGAGMIGIVLFLAFAFAAFRAVQRSPSPANGGGTSFEAPPVSADGAS